MHPFDCDCRMCRLADEMAHCRWCDKPFCAIDHVAEDIAEKARLSALDEVSDETER